MTCTTLTTHDLRIARLVALGDRMLARCCTDIRRYDGRRSRRWFDETVKTKRELAMWRLRQENKTA